MLGLILTYVFGFLLSLPGLFALLLGVVLFLTLPIIPRVSDEFHRLANFHLWNATAMLGRAAVVVSEHGEVLLKRMTFDDLGIEKISFDDDVKEFEDPASASHYWMGIRFALADEVHGVLFDPRHAKLGKLRADARERGETGYFATEAEFVQYGVYEWKKALFELPRGVYESVNLGQVRQLVDGGERAEYPPRVEAFYENSREPFKSGTSTSSLIMIVVAMVGPFAALWLLATQTGSSGGGGGSTVSFAALLAALSLTSIREWVTSVDWLSVAKRAVIVSVLPLLFLVLFVLVSPIFAIFFFLTLGAGFWIVPAFVQVAKASTIISEMLGPLLMRTGLKGYRRPVFEWTPRSYRLREASDLEGFDEENATYYGLCGSLVAFTFTPEEESWGAEIADADEMDSRAEVVTDGGSPSAPESNIPAGYRRVPDEQRGDIFAGFVPRRLDVDDNYYLHTGIAYSKFTESATGEKSLRRLTKAKEKYGGEGGLSDKSVAYAMVISGALSFLAGVFVFFL